MATSKKSLRESALLARGQILPDARARAAHAVMTRFMSGVTLPPQAVIAGYWPVKGEVDVIPLLKELIRRGHRCCLPHIMDFKRPLVFREWHETSAMVEGRFGIHQPDPETCDALVPHVVITPLLGFDGRGQRLGYGSGFYDRTFDQLHDIGHKFTAIGAAFEAQRLDEVPADAYDYAMDMIVTEQTIHHFGRRA